MKLKDIVLEAELEANPVQDYTFGKNVDGDAIRKHSYRDKNYGTRQTVEVNCCGSWMTVSDPSDGTACTHCMGTFDAEGNRIEASHIEGRPSGLTNGQEAELIAKGPLAETGWHLLPDHLSSSPAGADDEEEAAMVAKGELSEGAVGRAGPAEVKMHEDHKKIMDTIATSATPAHVRGAHAMAHNYEKTHTIAIKKEKDKYHKSGMMTTFKTHMHEQGEALKKAYGKFASELKESRNIQVGDRVQPVMGANVHCVATVVPHSEIKTDGHGIPTNVEGAYKPVDWNRGYHAVKYQDGTYDYYHHSHLNKLHEALVVDGLRLFEGGNNTVLLRRYLRNEDINAHTENAALLANHFGTKEEKAEAEKHMLDMKRNGHGSPEGSKFQYDMSQKYYGKLHEAVLNEERWSAAVKTHHHPRAGLYATGSGEEIAKAEMSGGAGKAAKRINFYLQRAGKNLSAERKAAVRHALSIVQSKEK